ncbi:MAG: hypothetical protein ACU826_07800 [Gammaproteobacteria bacterium]
MDSEGYLLKVMRYIDLNPVRAGSAVRPGECPWPSRQWRAQGGSEVDADWMTAHEEYPRLGR